jgi:molybdate transport system substrate-binding protein
LVKQRKLAVIVGTLLVVLVFGAVAFVFLTRGDDSNVITRTVRGEGNARDGNTISIYAPNQLSKVLERVTTTFQQENPGTTFQFTLGPSEELSKRIQDGQKPSLYIDLPSAIAPLSGKVPTQAQPVPFGYDMVQLAVKRGNPKQVDGLGVFGPGSPINTGICARDVFCGQADAIALDGARVNAAPKVVTSNVSELTDGVKSGRIDAVLLLRTDLRSVLTSITNIPVPQHFRVDYQIAQLQSGGATDQFLQWMQGSPSARQTLRLAGMLSFYEP